MIVKNRGRIPGQSLKSSPPYYSQSPLQIYISSNSRNLLCVSSKSSNLVHISTIQLLYTVKEKGGKPYRKPYPLPYGLRNPYRNLNWELSRLCPETQKPQQNCTFMNSASSKESLDLLLAGKGGAGGGGGLEGVVSLRAASNLLSCLL